ncbi:MAG: hypothetical protein ACOC32_04220, partial [Nanoarchaeota archaeon]
MGFSGLASQIIMFIAVITVASGLVIVFNTSISETSSSIEAKTDTLALTMKTDVTIDMISYDDATNTTYVYIKNTGKTTLTTNNTDIYLNGFRVERNISKRTIEVLSDTDTINPGSWDPKEQVLIKVMERLNSSTSHKVTITTEYDVKDTEE